ncbi:MAG: CDP-alcohol phosphatidyltransferase family protein [Promethearchaeota archaeon]|jgi:CDP-diacylglycerol--serine O-phosphatidyltransferase
MSISIPNLLKVKDYVTLTGSALGIIALICACLGFNHREYISVGFFLVTLTLGTDMIDGYIARKTKTDNDIGRELDSLSDSLTFGIAPAILTFQAFRTGTVYDIFLIIGAVCFAYGAILRLARFNISEIPGYTGVPTPVSAILLILYFYANYFYAFGRGGITYPFPVFANYLVPFLMILIAWFNITTHVRFGKKDKATYLGTMILTPFCPILGIIGLLNPNFVVSTIVSIIFIILFTLFIAFIIRGFLQQTLKKGENN